MHSIPFPGSARATLALISAASQIRSSVGSQQQQAPKVESSMCQHNGLFFGTLYLAFLGGTVGLPPRDPFLTSPCRPGLVFMPIIAGHRYQPSVSVVFFLPFLFGLASACGRWQELVPFLFLCDHGPHLRRRSWLLLGVC